MWFKADETLTEEQARSGLSYVIKDGIASQAMGILTGGGFVLCGDKDCNTESGSCPGGDTCEPGSVNQCYDSESGNGQECGEPGGMGWQCVDTTESCNGAEGSCNQNTCETMDPTGQITDDNCGTRPDC